MTEVRSREEFVEVIRALSQAARIRNPERTNLDVPTYLEALSAWTNDMDGWFANEGRPVPEASWSLFATILEAALVYS